VSRRTKAPPYRIKYEQIIDGATFLAECELRAESPARAAEFMFSCAPGVTWVRILGVDYRNPALAQTAAVEQPTNIMGESLPTEAPPEFHVGLLREWTAVVCTSLDVEVAVARMNADYPPDEVGDPLWRCSMVEPCQDHDGNKHISFSRG